MRRVQCAIPAFVLIVIGGCGREAGNPPKDSTTASARAVATSQAEASPCPRGEPGLCFQDRTTSVIGNGDYDYGSWVVFSGAGDSVEFFGRLARGDTGVIKPYVGMALDNPWGVGWGINGIGQTRGPWIRARIPAAGAYSLAIHANGEHFGEGGLLYSLRILFVEYGRSPFADRLKPTGNWARFSATGDTTSRVALIPNSVAGELTPKDYRGWGIWPGAHSVLLVSDTLYRVCKLPCTKLDLVVLKPGTHVVKTF